MEKKQPLSRATVVDVARRAGVGVGTVSRVINNSRHVRPDTAQAVRRAMALLGYQPSPPEQRPGPRHGKRRHATQAAALKDVILLIFGRQGLRWILDCAPVYAYVLEGIETALAQVGRKLVIRQAEDWSPMGHFLRKADAEGLIILGQTDPQEPAPSILMQMPTVWVMGSPRRFAGDHVTADHLQVGALAADYLLAQGHRRCAYLGTEVGSMNYQVGLRCSAFQWRIEDAGGSTLMLVHRDLNIVGAGINAPNEPLLGQMLDQLWSAHPRPTALMLQADMFAPSVYRHLLERGIHPQRDLAIVTCNNERPYLASLQPAPAVIDLQAQAIGHRAVEQLLWRRTHRDEPSQQVLVRPKLLAPADNPSPGLTRPN